MQLTTKLLPVLLLAACAITTPLSEEAVRAADYGPPPPSNYAEMIKATFEPLLIDPTSPLYTFDTPKKGYTLATRAYGRPEPSFGWRVCGTLNSKNRMGGYSGPKGFFVLFKQGRIDFFEIADQDREIPQVALACQRTVPQP